MAVQQPPVLKKVKKPNDDQVIETLKLIDSRLENVEKLIKVVDKSKPKEPKKKKPTKEQPKEKINPPAVIPPKAPPVEKLKKKNPIANAMDRMGNNWTKKTEELRVSIEKTREDIGDKLERGLPTMAAQMTRGLLGPLNLITQPLGDFFGFQMEDMMKPLFTKKEDKKEFTKKGKVIKPKRADILKSNPEIVWAHDEDKKDKNKKKEEDSTDGLLNALGMGSAAAIAKKLWPALLKAAPFAAIAGGLIWATIDGIRAMGESEKWGVDKVPAFLGGFFAGNGEGWKGVMANATKWGLVGLGIGALIGGPIGAIAGALLGAALGGVFNWIGAENASKAFNDIAIKLGMTEDKTEAGRSQDEIFKKRSQIADTYEKLWDQGKFDDTTFGENSATKTEKIKRVLNAKNYSSFTADAYGSNAMYLMDELNNLQNQLNTVQYLPKEMAKGKQADLEAKQKAIVEALGKLDTDSKDKKSTNAEYLFNELNSKYGYSFTPFEKQKNSGVVKVNDAIISPDGRIVQPSASDTIIATKSPVYNSNFDKQQYDFEDISKSIENSFNGDKIVQAINNLINIVQNKPFNNIIQNQQPSIDFDKLRFA